MSSPPQPAPGLEELYRAEAERLVAWARLRIRPEHRGLVSPEDVAQEVWCRALEKFATFDPAAGPFRAWVLTVAKFVLAEITRSAFYQQRLKHEDGRSSMIRVREQVPEMVTTITTRAARNEATERLFVWVDQLDEVDRQVFTFHFMEGLPQKDVGARLGMQANAIAKRWERLRARLRAVAPAWLEVDEEPDPSPP